MIDLYSDGYVRSFLCL